MSSILAILRETQGAIERLSDVEGFTQSLERTKQVEGIFREIPITWQKLRVIAGALGISDGLEISKELKVTLEESKKLVDLCFSNPSQSNLNDLTTHVSILNEKLQSVNLDLKSRIQTYWLPKIQEISSNRRNALQAFSVLKNMSDQIRNLTIDAERLSSVVLPTLLDVEKMEDLLTRIKVFYKEQAGDSSVIISFVEAASSSQGATYEQFSQEEVQIWLAKKGLLNATRVKL
jgi:hypothetical protein